MILLLLALVTIVVAAEDDVPTTTPTSPTVSSSILPTTSSYPTSSNIPTSSSYPSPSPTKPSLRPSVQPSSTLKMRGSFETIPYPRGRYVDYATITDMEYVMDLNELGYTLETWNLPGSYHQLEGLSYGKLSTGQRNVVDDLGWSDTTWDCYINHYKDYTWEQLQDAGVVLYYETLGYDEMKWNTASSSGGRKDHHAFSESLTWQELPVREKLAAKELCYFEEIWNTNYILGVDW